MEKDVQHFSSLDEGSRALAAQILKTARAEIAKKHFFTLVLSGGATPLLLYKLLAGYPFTDHMPWHSVHLFWGDERFVPQDHQDSNFAMVNEALISNVPIPPENIHPIPTNLKSADASASMYERTIRDFFQVAQAEDKRDQGQKAQIPQFDIVLLGLGTDGHTASLFPNTKAIHEKRRWVSALTPPQGVTPHLQRITLTYPIIEQAQSVVFLLSGEDKKHIAEAIQNDPEHTGHYPAAHIKARKKLSWYICD